jgi:ABC-2 type transport system ATP-binding protein
MIEISELTKRYGKTIAVDGLRFTVPPGQVIGFLGPNGAGKSTTIRMIVGLTRPDGGTTSVNGLSYVRHSAPLREVRGVARSQVRPQRSQRVQLSTGDGPDARHPGAAKRIGEVDRSTCLV